MKKKFREFIEDFAEGYTEEELRNKKYMAIQIRETADENDTFENVVFEIGVHTMVKRLTKVIGKEGIPVYEVDEKEAIRLLLGLKLYSIHTLSDEDGVPEGKVCVFSMVDDEENKRRFKNLIIFDYGELRITDFY